MAQNADQRFESKLRGTASQRARAMRSSRKDRLAKLAKAVGNNEIQQRIQQGNVNRDMCLAYIAERLRGMRQLQLREQRLVPRGSHWTWWRQVADKYKTWFTKPEPTRWHEAARLYEQAARQLARGDVSRGKELLERAMKEETHQLANLTSLVSTADLDFAAKPEVGWLNEIVDTEPGQPSTMPADIALAREIQLVEDTVPDPMNRRRRRDPWWTLDEDEEEEDEDGAG